MTAILLRRLALAALILVAGAAATAQSPLVVGDEGRYALTRHLVFVEDRSGTLDIAAAASPEYSGRYRPVDGGSELNFGYSASAYWLRATLAMLPSATDEWLLEIAFPSLDDVQVFTLDARGNFRRQVAGDLRPFAQRPYPHRNFVFPLHLAPGTSQNVYIRVASQGSLTIPATLWSPTQFHAHDQQSLAALCLYFGMLVALALYNLMLYVSLRDSVFLGYVAFVTSMVIGQAALTGLGNQYLWPDWPSWGNLALPIGMSMAGLFGALFTRSFLDTAVAAPRLDRLILILALAFVVSALSAVVSYRLAAVLTSLTGLAFALAATASGVYFMIRNRPSARYFLLAWTLLLLGVAVLALRNLDWLPTTWLTIHAMQIGSGLEVLLLSFALADRVNVARREKEQAQEALVLAKQQIVDELKRSEQVLDARIAERTADLAQVSARYQSVVDNVKEVIFQTDAEGLWTFLNPAWTEVTGFAVEQSLGNPFLDYVHADDRRRNQELFEPLIARRKDTCRHEIRYLHRDGGFRWIEVFARLTLEASGKIVGTSGTLMDITERRTLEEDLRRRDRYQRAVLDNFPFPVWLKDAHGRFLAVNAPFAQACSQPSPEALIGRNDFDIWPPDLAERYRADDQAVLASARPKAVEEPIEQGGQRCWFETYKAPVSLGGEIIGTVGFSRDITEKRRIEAELDRHRHHLEEIVAQRTAQLAASEANTWLILDSTADGLFGVDVQGRATFMNPAACRMLGYAPEQVLGRPMHALIHHTRSDGSAYPAEQCPLHSTLQSGREYHADKDVYWHADGHPVPVMHAAHPILRDGQLEGAVVSFMDITALMAAEEARERALLEAENLARVRHAFLANMSHEIRTPLNGVLGMAQIGLRASEGRTKSKEAFGRILDSGKLLLGVLNDILDFSKIDAGRLDIQAVAYDLGELLDEAVALLAERACSKGIGLRVDKAGDLPQRCVGDELRVQQVLVNLLSNAVKFTHAGEVVLAAEREGNQLLLQVSDTGIGMNSEQIARIFDPFEQADGSMTRRYGGTGLGLTISRRLVELMQGTIHVTSQPGQGSRFEVRLPLVEATAAPPSVASPMRERDASPLAGLRLLVAEDTDINRMVLEELLTQEGARVVLAEDGRQAVDTLIRDGTGAYDLVLMDIQMPVMDGYEATRRIRELAPDLPVVGQSAHAMAQARAECLAAGMVDHVAKPVDIHDLVDVVLRHARRRSV